MKSNVFLYLLFLIPSVAFAQKQISDIKYFEKVVDQPRKGFINLEDEDYFIEQGQMETKVSLISGNELQLLHTITARPIGLGYDFLQTNYSNSNSGLIYEDELLFELYPSIIYAIDFTTGNLDHAIDLEAAEILYLSDFIITENHYYFFGIQDENSSYFSYNRLSQELKKMPFGVNEELYKIGFRIYFHDTALERIDSYDLLTQDVLTYEFSQASISEVTYNDKTQLLITDEVNNKISLIDDQHNLINLNCLDDKNPIEVYVATSQIMYTTEIDNKFYLNVVDRNSCAEISQITMPGHLSFRDFGELYDDYIILSDFNDWMGIATFYIYDQQAASFTELSIEADGVYPQRAVKYDDKFYFVTWDDLHYTGLSTNIFVLDLLTKEVSTIEDYLPFDIYDVTIGEHKNEKELFIYFDTKEESVLKNYIHANNDLHALHTFNYLKNTGLRYGIYENIWHDDKLFFYCRNAMYVLEGEEVIKIIDAGNYPRGFSTTGFIIKDEKLHTMMGKDSLVFKVTLDVNDYSYDLKLMEGMNYLDYRRPVTDYALINVPNSSSLENTGYYNLEDETFKSFQHNGSPFLSNKFTLSGNNVLLDRFGASVGKRVIFNTKNETSTLTEIPDDEYPTAYPDGKGGFFLVPWQFSENNTDLMHLDENGKVSSIFDDFKYNVFYDGVKVNGELRSIAFDAEEEMIIFSAKGNDYKMVSIPDGDLKYYERFHFYWQQTEKLSALEVPNGDSYDTYLFGFDFDPVKINEEPRKERLVDVIVEVDKVVLFYLDKENKEMTFEDFDFATEATSLRNTLDIYRNYYSNKIKIDDERYMLNIDDVGIGTEPWIYNVSDGSIALLKDIKSGFTGSWPDQMFRSPNGQETYFTAVNNQDERQIFIFDEDSVNPILSFDQSSKTDLSVTPSPTNGEISLNQRLSHLKIYNVQGQMVYFQQDYLTEQDLNVNHLNNGLYFIHAINTEGEYCNQKFYVSKD